MVVHSGAAMVGLGGYRSSRGDRRSMSGDGGSAAIPRGRGSTPVPTVPTNICAARRTADHGARSRDGMVVVRPARCRRRRVRAALAGDAARIGTPQRTGGAASRVLLHGRDAHGKRPMVRAVPHRRSATSRRGGHCARGVAGESVAGGGGGAGPFRIFSFHQPPKGGAPPRPSLPPVCSGGCGGGGRGER